MGDGGSTAGAGLGWERDIEKGERFGFGQNWSSFLRLLNEERIRSAEDSLREMIGLDRFDGRTFLDIGSGSGLFSLAARRLGARVTSFDYDPQSKACTAELKRRYFPGDPNWVVEQASILDREFIGGLGTFDIVYSWGVLHHTGSMWEALANVAPLVASGGTLFIAIYNDQGLSSRLWTKVKRAYVRAPSPLRAVILGASLVRLWGPAAVRKLLGAGVGSSGQQQRAVPRGMDRWHDAKDWVGGYPFEVAKPEEIFAFYRDRGFPLSGLKTCGGGIGCNEYVFVRSD